MSTRTQDKRLWLAGGALTGILVLAIGWLLVVSPELTDAAVSRDQAESARSQNSILAAKNTTLKKLNDDVTALQGHLTGALAELPSDSGLPDFTRQLTAQAAANSVIIQSIIVSGVGPVGETTGGVTAATEGTAGLVQISISVLADGPCDGQRGFLSAIQTDGPRRALLNSILLNPQSDAAGTYVDGNCTLTLQLNLFSAPVTPDEQAALQKLLSGS